MKYRVCPYCHCNIDFGEKCDCLNTKNDSQKIDNERRLNDEFTSKLYIRLSEKSIRAN